MFAVFCCHRGKTGRESGFRSMSLLPRMVRKWRGDGECSPPTRLLNSHYGAPALLMASAWQLLLAYFLVKSLPWKQTKLTSQMEERCPLQEWAETDWFPSQALAILDPLSSARPGMKVMSSPSQELKTSFGSLRWRGSAGLERTARAWSSSSQAFWSLPLHCALALSQPACSPSYSG